MGTIKHYAKLYRRSERTIKRWQAQGLPLDDRARMRDIIDEMRSRRGVSKFTPKSPIETQTPDAEQANPEGDLIAVHFALVYLAWDDAELRTRLKPALDITRKYVEEATRLAAEDRED